MIQQGAMFETSKKKRKERNTTTALQFKWIKWWNSGKEMSRSRNMFWPHPYGIW